MKKNNILCKLTLLIICTFLLAFTAGCNFVGFETVAEHDARIAREQEEMRLAYEESQKASSNNNKSKASSDDKNQLKSDGFADDANAQPNKNNDIYNQSGDFASAKNSQNPTDNYNSNQDFTYSNLGKNGGQNSNMSNVSTNSSKKDANATTNVPDPVVCVHFVIQANVIGKGTIYNGDVLIHKNHDNSVYDALINTGLSISGSSGYITGISGIMEKSAGSMSGWKYITSNELNSGNMEPGVGCGDYMLNGGETIYWFYVTDPAMKYQETL